MTDYEQALTEGLENQFGANWWHVGATPQHFRDYCAAATDAERLRIRRDMEAQTRALMHQMLQAGLLAGVVTAM